MIVPSDSQVAPQTFLFVSVVMATGAPPLNETFFSFPFAKNPTQRLNVHR